MEKLEKYFLKSTCKHHITKKTAKGARICGKTEIQRKAVTHWFPLVTADSRETIERLCNTSDRVERQIGGKNAGSRLNHPEICFYIVIYQ